jgi:protein TonB
LGATRYSASRKRFDWFGFMVVLAAHVVVLAWLSQQRILQMPRSVEPLFVHFVAPEPPPKPEPPQPVRREPPKPRVEKKPPPEPPRPQEQLVVEAPVVQPLEPVAPPPPPPPLEPVGEAAPVLAPVVPKPVGPVSLADELSVSCPDRAPPLYPALSRRLREEGQVLLRVELDEQGRVGAARIEKPSGSQRLDDAALAAVRGWRCKPVQRDGKPVRATALQPFNFVLQ